LIVALAIGFGNLTTFSDPFICLFALSGDLLEILSDRWGCKGGKLPEFFLYGLGRIVAC